MFFSLAQTLCCVLLIQGGLYALHLNGNQQSSSSSGSSSSSSGINSGNHMMQVLRHQNSNNNNGDGGGFGSSGGGGGLLIHRPQSHLKPQQYQQPHFQLNSADMAALERERIMMQAAANTAAAAAAATGHHGRPIITGRVQMTPADLNSDGTLDYALMQQQQHSSQQQQKELPRNYLFGSVVKQPPREHDDYDTTEEFDGGGRYAARQRPTKYEYGRIVQSSERTNGGGANGGEFDPTNIDLNDFIELEVADPEIDDIIPDLDGYQYLDELLAEQNNKAWLEEVAAQQQQQRYQQNPYQVLEDELEANPPQALQELFKKEREREIEHEREKESERAQHDAPAAVSALHKEMLPKTRNGGQGGGYNIRLHQKWQRKRNQQQQQQLPLQRNIFGGHQKHHFLNSLHNTKFSLANSEATATKHVDTTNTRKQQADVDNVDEDIDAAATVIKNNNLQSNSNQQQQAENINSNNNNKQQASTSASSLSSTSKTLNVATNHNNNNINMQKNLRGDASSSTATAKEHLLQSNHKRSGAIMSGVGGGLGGYVSSAATGGLQPPPVSHSIASQLMLRTARGQRQYDVPQIECPTAMDGMERFACPTPDLQGRYRCIDDHVLCDGFIDCPEGEDEDRRSCMFYKTTKAHLDVLADALLRWARGR